MVRLGCACAIIWWASGHVRADLVLPVIGTGSVVNASLNEISGLAYSPTGGGMLWAIEDSGNSARLIKLGTNGALNGSYALPSPVTNRDWEDIAFANGYVHVGEIGDNNAAYLSVKVHRVLHGNSALPLRQSGVCSRSTSRLGLWNLYRPCLPGRCGRAIAGHQKSYTEGLAPVVRNVPAPVPLARLQLQQFCH
jgi:hypothetical protein